jgi:hypothetical protein
MRKIYQIILSSLPKSYSPLCLYSYSHSPSSFLRDRYSHLYSSRHSHSFQSVAFDDFDDFDVFDDFDGLDDSDFDDFDGLDDSHFDGFADVFVEATDFTKAVASADAADPILVDPILVMADALVSSGKVVFCSHFVSDHWSGSSDS